MKSTIPTCFAQMTKAIGHSSDQTTSPIKPYFAKSLELSSFVRRSRIGYLVVSHDPLQYFHVVLLFRRLKLRFCSSPFVWVYVVYVEIRMKEIENNNSYAILNAY